MQEKDSIKYLIKFVSKIEYADMLVNGDFFMRPAKYYWNSLNGRGDVREGALSHAVRIHKNSGNYIYCMYAVKECDICNNIITIPQICIDDFECQNGFIVLIDFVKFEKYLPKIQTNGYMLTGGLIQYHYIQPKDFTALANSKDFLPLYVKHPHYSYQNEYRIVIGKSTRDENSTKILSLTGGIKDISSIIPISTLAIADDYYKLNLNNV